MGEPAVGAPQRPRNNVPIGGQSNSLATPCKGSRPITEASPRLTGGGEGAGLSTHILHRTGAVSLVTEPGINWLFRGDTGLRSAGARL